MSIRTIPLLPMNSGHAIPQLGVGTWPLDGEELSGVVVAAIERGYTHIDTARKYGNEAAVGEGIRRSGVDRAGLFVATKLDGQHQGEDRAVEGLRGCLERLAAEGLARSIGVSNFLPEHLDRLAHETDVMPAVNQIQLSPYIQRPTQEAYHEAHGILTEAWSPLGGGGASVLGDPVLTGIAAAHDATPGQVALAWHLAQGRVVIPKTANPDRLGQNLEALDLELTPDELVAIDALTRPGTGVDPNTTGH